MLFRSERAMLLDPGNLHLRYDLACTYVELREFDAALDVLGSALQKEVHSNFLDWVKTDPDMDAIRGHPRFKEMLAAAETRLAQP